VTFRLFEINAILLNFTFIEEKNAATISNKDNYKIFLKGYQTVSGLIDCDSIFFSYYGSQ